MQGWASMSHISGWIAICVWESGNALGSLLCSANCSDLVFVCFFAVAYSEVLSKGAQGQYTSPVSGFNGVAAQCIL